MSSLQRWVLVIVSLIVVAFGQPAWSVSLALVAAAVGYALFWWAMLQWVSPWRRFFLAVGWFAAGHAVQLSWMGSHPYSYIYAVIVWLSLQWGVVFGLVSLLITRERLRQTTMLLALAGLVTSTEWLRLFLLAGYSLNPSGMALSASLVGMQLATVGGVYGLSFWVILTNLLALRWIIGGCSRRPLLFFAAAVAFPYLFGVAHVAWRDLRSSDSGKTLSVLMVETRFPAEETMGLHHLREYVSCAKNQWQYVVESLAQHRDKQLDMVVLPEGLVPFGSGYCMYHADEVLAVFETVFGRGVLPLLPPLERPYAAQYDTRRGTAWMATNAFWAQALANILDADLLVGLEYFEGHKEERRVYNAAQLFRPGETLRDGEMEWYGKRVLLPMAEYIPFQWAKRLAAQYGISDSYTHGPAAVVFAGQAGNFGASICYEETFGHLMRENRLLGADLLINVTSDVWYPHSRLGQQHFDHARLRTVELGVPLLRSCNYGLSGAIDSLGRVVAMTHLDRDVDWEVDAVWAEVPAANYHTPYALWGDVFIIVCSLLFVALGLWRAR